MWRQCKFWKTKLISNANNKTLWNWNDRKNQVFFFICQWIKLINNKCLTEFFFKIFYPFLEWSFWIGGLKWEGRKKKNIKVNTTKQWKYMIQNHFDDKTSKINFIKNKSIYTYTTGKTTWFLQKLNKLYQRNCMMLPALLLYFFFLFVNFN